MALQKNKYRVKIRGGSEDYGKQWTELQNTSTSVVLCSTILHASAWLEAFKACFSVSGDIIEGWALLWERTRLVGLYSGLLLVVKGILMQQARKRLTLFNAWKRLSMILTTSDPMNEAGISPLAFEFEPLPRFFWTDVHLPQQRLFHWSAITWTAFKSAGQGLKICYKSGHCCGGLLITSVL